VTLRARAVHDIAHCVSFVARYAHEPVAIVNASPGAFGAKLAPSVLYHEPIGNVHETLVTQRDAGIRDGLHLLRPRRAAKRRIERELRVVDERIDFVEEQAVRAE